MKRRDPLPAQRGKNRGFSLIEVVVVSAIASLMFLFILRMIRDFGTGVAAVQRSVPMQSDLQFAKQVIETDLLSAPRSSIGNKVPNPGFEAVPTRVSTFTPPTPGFWACPPVRPRLNPVRLTQGYITARPGFFLNGNYGLTLNLKGSNAPNNVSYSAESSTFTLIPSVDYLFGGWFFENKTYDGSPWRLQLLRGPNWPSTIGISLHPGGMIWKFSASTFTATADNYRVVAAAFNVDGQQTAGTFDDIIVTPLALNLVPGGPSFEFDHFETKAPNTGQREQIRYRVVTEGLTGRLVRERITASGTVVPLDSVKNVRRLLIGWDFGQGAPGVLPPMGSWPALFAKGMNFPLFIRIETGNVGATGNKTLALTFSVFPEAP